MRDKISGINLAQREGEWIADFIVQTASVAFDAEEVVATVFNDQAK